MTRAIATIVLALFIVAFVDASLSDPAAATNQTKSSTQQGNTKSKRGRG